MPFTRRARKGEGSYKKRNYFLEKHALLHEAKNGQVKLELLLAANIFLRGMISFARHVYLSPSKFTILNRISANLFLS